MEETVGPEQEPEAEVPAWLAPDDEAVPEALQAVYAKVSVGVKLLCERGRKAMRDGSVRGLCAVHKALAPSGLFKDWCQAVGPNYETAKSIVARAEQAAGVRPHSRPPATSQLVVHFADAEQKAITVSRLRDVLDAPPEAGEDDWACAILALLASWEEHQATTAPEGEAA